MNAHMIDSQSIEVEFPVYNCTGLTDERITQVTQIVARLQDTISGDIFYVEPLVRVHGRLVGACDGISQSASAYAYRIHLARLHADEWNDLVAAVFGPLQAQGVSIRRLALAA